ncbi:MAG: MFS transporter [Bacteroidota bacterium]|nr:MFS transporter [Candidatus Kapabacteria bacterium]MCS7303264.1 MFS transporter [Candidatus Kapabacteria bacterium]MCX7937312.1 MFS transporter [Chlorobiota bacterium]MDW8075574.1 MFS transporter [Bacteroidota bacterium]MDW8271747.1 MFS transporter [Bacteroidota bacterium]
MNTPLSILFVTVLLDLIGFGIILPVLPLYARTLGADEVTIGLIASSFSLMTLIWSPIFGRWSDRAGRRPILLSCILLNAAGYALFANATSLSLLIISRMLNGIGAANISVAQAYIADITAGSDRARSLGLIGAAFGLGFIIGPALGGFLKAHGGISAVGYVPAALSLLNAAVAWIRLPEPQRERAASVHHHSYASSIKVAFAAPVRRQLIVLSFAYWFAFVMMQITFVLFANERFGWREDTIGILFALIGVIGAAIQGGAIGPLVRLMGEKQLLTVGMVLFSTGMLLLPWIPIASLVIAIVALMAAGSALINPSVNALLSRSADSASQGAVLGMAQSAASLARIVGPIVGMGLYGIRHEIPYIAAGVIGIISLFSLILPLAAGESSA